MHRVTALLFVRLQYFMRGTQLFELMELLQETQDVLDNPVTQEEIEAALAVKRQTFAEAEVPYREAQAYMELDDKIKEAELAKQWISVIARGDALTSAKAGLGKKQERVDAKQAEIQDAEADVQQLAAKIEDVQ